MGPVSGWSVDRVRTGMFSDPLAVKVAAFHPAFWPGTIYHDEEKVFYKALGDGKLVKGNMAAFLNPFSQAWTNVRRASKHVKDHNLKGDGLTMGGLFVVDTSGAVKFMHVEKTFGEHATSSEVCGNAERFTVSPEPALFFSGLFVTDESR
jgi:hypothetical protein